MNNILKHFFKPFLHCKNRLERYHEKKLTWLLKIKKDFTLNKIKPFYYTCRIDDKGRLEQISNYISKHSNKNVFSFAIEPQEFNELILNSLEKTNEKWFYNLTDTNIPTDVSRLLQMGCNFCLPISFDKRNAIYGFIKDLESINNMNIALRLTPIRNMAIPLLLDFISKKVL